MNGKDISDILNDFRRQMLKEGKSRNTVSKYLRDVRQFLLICGNEPDADEEEIRVQAYRSWLGKNYTAASANSKISAVNYFYRKMRQSSVQIRVFKVQNAAFRKDERNLTREEYVRLLREAKKRRNNRLYLIMQTIAATGIRVSELRFVTMEAILKRQMEFRLKGKVRTVLLPDKLCRFLREYAGDQGIEAGPIFITRYGKPVDRSNLLHDMKRLGSAAGVSPNKIFPHNLRHLFAVTYYEAYKDLSHLADILGHSDINVTRMYAAMSSSEYRQGIEELKLLEEEKD